MHLVLLQVLVSGKHRLLRAIVYECEHFSDPFMYIYIYMLSTQCTYFAIFATLLSLQNVTSFAVHIINTRLTIQNKLYWSILLWCLFYPHFIYKNVSCRFLINHSTNLQFLLALTFLPLYSPFTPCQQEETDRWKISLWLTQKGG